MLIIPLTFKTKLLKRCGYTVAPVRDSAEMSKPCLSTSADSIPTLKVSFNSYHKIKGISY